MFFQDNKDLGLDKCNLNYETPTAKVTGKTVHEVKIQNDIQDNTRSKIGNKNNAENMVPNGLNQAAAVPNINQQLRPSPPKPGQERKLSS